MTAYPFSLPATSPNYCGACFCTGACRYTGVCPHVTPWRIPETYTPIEPATYGAEPTTFDYVGVTIDVLPCREAPA